MTYSEKVNLEAEKSARIAIHNESDMLQGNINRMFLTDDMNELNRMYGFAITRILRIYEYHNERIIQLQSINGGTEQCGQ